jgi:hypothetical protein
MWSTRLSRSVVRAGAVLGSSAVLSVALVATSAAPGFAAVPTTPRFGAAIENLSPYQPQTTCHPTAQRGVLEFRALILRTYRDSGDDGIVRACSSGGTSEHKEGRAWDWMVSYKNAHQVAEVHALFAWLFKADAFGHRYAMARRLGIMYVIWDKRIWGSYRASEGWRPYSCSGVTLCHQNHVHFSFSKPGAKGITSYWTKVVVDVGGSTGTSVGQSTGTSTGTSGGQSTSTGTRTGTTAGPTGARGGTDGDDPALWTNGGGSTRGSVPAPAIRTGTVSALVAPATVEADAPFTVAGRLTTSSGTPVAGRVVRVAGRLAGDDSWQEVADVVTDGAGRWSIPVQAPASAEVVARFYGSPTLLPSRSPVVPVTVPDVTAGDQAGEDGYDGYGRYSRR